MTDFCPLSIQPDELALSYRARLARFNGWTNATIAARHLEDWVTQQRHSEERLSAVEVLAAVAGMDVTTFVRNHTMLPFQRAVVSTHETVPHGSAERRTLLAKRAYCATRKNLYFCPTCAIEDIQANGSAYWRRSHQLPGMFCCLRHKTALKSILWTLEFMELPNDYIESGEEIPAARFRAGRGGQRRAPGDVVAGRAWPVRARRAVPLWCVRRRRCYVRACRYAS